MAYDNEGNYFDEGNYADEVNYGDTGGMGSDLAVDTGGTEPNPDFAVDMSPQGDAAQPDTTGMISDGGMGPDFAVQGYYDDSGNYVDPDQFAVQPDGTPMSVVQEPPPPPPEVNPDFAVQGYYDDNGNYVDPGQFAVDTGGGAPTGGATTSGVNYLTGADISYIAPPPPTEGANEGTYDNEGNYIPPYTNPYANGFLKIGDKNIAAAGLESGGGFNGSYYAARTNTGDLAAAVMASDGQGVRLVDGSGNIIYEGTGSKGAQDATSLANYISTSDGKNAAWNIQIEDPANKGTYNSAGYESVDKVKNKFDVGSFLVDIAVPMVLMAIPGMQGFGAAMMGGLGATGTLAAVGATALNAGLGSVAAGIVNGRSAEDIIKSAGMTMLTAGALKGVGADKIINNTIGKVTNPIQGTLTSTVRNGIDGVLGAGTSGRLAGEITTAATKLGEGTVSAINVFANPLTSGVNAVSNLVGAGSNLVHGSSVTNNKNTTGNAKNSDEGVLTDDNPSYINPDGSVQPKVTPTTNPYDVDPVTVTGTRVTAATPNIPVGPPTGNDVEKVEVLGKRTPTGPPSPVVNVDPLTDPKGDVEKVEVLGKRTPTGPPSPVVPVDPLTDPEGDVEKVEVIGTKPTGPIIVVPPITPTGPTTQPTGPTGTLPTGPTTQPTGPIIVVPSDTKPKTPKDALTIDDLRDILGKNFRAKLPKSRMQLGQRQVTLTPEQWRQYALYPRGGPQRGGEEAFFNYAVEPLMKPVAAARGGAINDFAVAAARGGRNFAVNGPGTGRSDSIAAKLSDGEYVMDAETVALLGDGSSKAGAQRLDQMRVNIRKHKGQNLAKGRFSVNAKSPERYMSGGHS